MDKVNEAYWRGYHNGYACAMEDNAKLTLVRCKDCEYKEALQKGSLANSFGYDGECFIVRLFIRDNCYCAWGKRREDE